MRSREPWRLPAGQSRAVPFLQAAVLFAALCIFARSAVLVLAAFLAAPVPAAQTLLHLGQQAVESRAAESSAESVAEAASAPSPAQEAAAPVQTGAVSPALMQVWSSILWPCSRTKPALPMRVR